MNQHLQKILDTIEKDKNLSEEERNAIIKSLKDADKEIEIVNFKLDRTEKVKRTTAILLEETIEELEQKRKAVEAQNRELEIESSLERVRTVAMGMNKPGDLLNICEVLFKELQLLGFNELRNAMIHKFVDERGYFLDHDYSDFSGGAITHTPYTGHPVVEKFMAEIRRTDDAFSEIAVAGKELEDWKEFRITNGQAPDPRLDGIPAFYYYFYSIGPADIGISTFSSISTDKRELLKRFRNVFDLAYRRFLDIEKAEAQAREAQVELAMERVRARTMAMQKSDELKEVIQVVYEQFVHLDVNTEHTGFVMDYKERDDRLIWVASKHGVPSQLTIPYFDSEYYNSFNEAKEKGWDFFATNLSFEDKNSFYRELFKYIPGLPEDAKEFYFNCKGLAISTVLLENVGLYIENFEGIPYSDEDNAILMRFGKVFQQTYTRFLDLQKAESQTREAQIEAALERVRSRTLAMQRSDELAETAAVLFRQLILLGIQPNRLYIAIVKDKSGYSEFWITDEDGSKVSSAFETNLNVNATFKKMLDGWMQEKRSIVIDMQGAELQEYFKYLSSINVPFKGGLAQKRRVQDIAYFNNGFIGIASPENLSQETTLLLERFAAVFNLTYTRFNDLKIAEAHAKQAEQDLIAIKEAKQNAEHALAELQVTQKQLIQSEKMASLGELTAGIAHEIQNPLNFVNNFSEVSNELIDELKTEKSKPKTERDDQLEEELLNDIAQNLEKINHHGKRADAIVKGMLQHSRSSSGQKEPTDINVLADKYFRLAYHGLRAKDKSFNATLKTDYDENIGKVNIIPQDIGRVVLNLITNAFYVVNEKALSAVLTLPTGQAGPTAAKYEPTVSVSTKKLNGMAEIKVTDNGNGIPPKVLDKIFQPFFTTKPTGQGTGLGLSLSYDIVKAHGGELKVETIENEGSTFIIQIPIN